MGEIIISIIFLALMYVFVINFCKGAGFGAGFGCCSGK